ncbi:MAG: hypothetical protein ACE5ES_00155 [Candidatus Nanoarchaeia archaeon]
MMLSAQTAGNHYISCEKEKCDICFDIIRVADLLINIRDRMYKNES